MASRVLPMLLLGMLLIGLVSCDSEPVIIPDSGQGDSAAAPDRGGDGAQPDASPDTLRHDLPLTLEVPLEGIYEVTGTYDGWGDYTGHAEIRRGDGEHRVYHTTLFDALFEGDRIASAWEGTILPDQEPYYVEAQLDRVGFITQYKTWTREGAEREPARYFSDLRRVNPRTLTGTFAPAVGPGPRFTETWTWVSDGGQKPIWRNERQARAAHDPLSNDQRLLIQTTFASFHSLPALQPYVNRPEFIEGMHYFIFDPTDFNFYRNPANRDVLRVIQKVVDGISLVETRLRNRAYRQTLAEKAAFFDNQFVTYNLNSAGLLAYYNPQTGERPFDLSALEWTGDYLTSQAMRYMTTKEQAALDNMLFALEGIMLCYDIVPTPGDYARTVREHIDDGNPQWVQGVGGPGGKYAQYDWLIGGNNDMMKGFMTGFLWAFLALDGLPGYDDVRQHMIDILDGLLTHSEIATNKQANELYLRLLHYVMTGDEGQNLLYQAIYLYLSYWMVDWGNGSRYEMGTADWSGNFMNIKTLIGLHAMERYLDQQGRGPLHLAEYKDAFVNALENVRNARDGFYNLAAATLGSFPAPPPELEDSIWVLREFPAPKELLHFDWRINPSFCMSPVPKIPWKPKWMEKDRTHSLYGYPMFERNPANIEWKDSPDIYTGAPSPLIYSGGDYLLAYWFGRYYGVITPTM